MKEMTIEEKAQRYDEVIEIARKEYKKHESFKGFCEMLVYILPELKESEDESIRKALCRAIWTYIPTEEGKEYIAWLEKQKKCSEEDEKKIDRAIWLMNHYCTHGGNNELREDVISGLESLKK